MLNYYLQKLNFKSFIFILIAGFLFSNCFWNKEKKPIAFTKVQTVAGLNKEFGEPFGIAVKDDEIYVSDGEKGGIWRILKDGKMQVFTNKLDTPSQIAFDRNGDLIVADSGTHTIKKVLKDGKVDLIAGVENKKGFQDGDAKTALFNAPVGVAVFENKIYVADTYNDKIRLIENGKISTLAGSEQGFADGEKAKFDTPTGLAIWTDGRILVADSDNGRIRVVDKDGKTWTLAGNRNKNSVDGLLNEAEFVQPTALVVNKFGAIYVADGNAIRVIGRRFIPLVETISNDSQGFLDDKPLNSKFNRPSGLSVDNQGNLFVADSENQLVRVFTGLEIGKKVSVKEFDKAQVSAAEFRKLSEPRWAYDPPERVREIAGTLGEIRGKLEDENSNVWFHNGLDIAGGYGETARFTRDEKVLRPVAVQNFETLRELIRLPTLGYIHIRLGRDAKQVPFDDDRFEVSFNGKEKPNGVRIPRGTKFKAGEAIGTLNSFNHVHLIAGRTGREMNALDALILPGISDSKKPQIENVTLFDKNWNEIKNEKAKESIELDGKIRIIVRAFDQMDGNAERRKLGLYKIGYQVFDENEKPLMDFQEPKWNIIFDRLPEREAVKLVYAKGSQSGATGETIFNYIATNEVHGGFMRENFFDVSRLKAGNYLLRVLVADFFGNIASEDIEFKK
ncbi:MAG: hypothetical protein ACR2J3_08345 [Aridibacter sp.]